MHHWFIMLILRSGKVVLDRSVVPMLLNIHTSRPHQTQFFL
jgi:hypothetical protein